MALESNDAGIATTVSTELGAKYQKRKVCRTTYPGTHADQPTTGSPHAHVHVHVHVHVAARDARRVQQRPRGSRLSKFQRGTWTGAVAVAAAAMRGGQLIWDKWDNTRFLFYCGGAWRITGSQWRAA